jgi:hypothetical protein
MSSQHPDPVRSPVVRNVRRLSNLQNQQMRGSSGNSQLPPAKRHVSVPAGVRDSSQRRSSIGSTIRGQNSNPSSSLNNSCVADTTQPVTNSPSGTQRWSIISPTATPRTSSRNTRAPSGNIQTDSTRCVGSNPASGIASTSTPLSSVEKLPTSIPTPEDRAIITNPLRMRATERNQRQRQRHLEPQAVSTSRSVVSRSLRIHRFGHSDMTRRCFATGRLLEPYMWNRRTFMSTSNLETVSCAMRRVAKALAEASHW